VEELTEEKSSLISENKLLRDQLNEAYEQIAELKEQVD
jgi:hypothetical protein